MYGNTLMDRFLKDIIFIILMADKSNNDIQNLQMLSATEHERLHGKMLTENQRETLRKNMAKATVMGERMA